MTRIQIRRRPGRPGSATMAAPKALLLAAVLVSSTTGACVSSGVDSYEDFRGAVDSDATCQQLFEMKDNFAGTSDESRVNDDLEEIGCDTPDSIRNDS